MKPFTILMLTAGLLTGALAKERPNILFVVCDDLNTHVSTSGYSPIHTPNLAQLAEASMTFNRAFCQYPVCGPSRASFLSGLYPESTGVLSNKLDIRKERPDTVTMPQHFKASGYWTASVGKVFHSPQHEPGEAVWDEFHRFVNDELPVVTRARKAFEAKHGPVTDRKNRKAWKARAKKAAATLDSQTPPGHGRSGLSDAQHKDGKNVRQVMKWLEDKPYGDKPFFIACGIQKPHVPFLAPDKYFDLYPAEKLEYYRDPPDLWENLPPSAISKRYQAFGFELGVEKDALRREYMQAYHACVSFIDTQLGLIFDALKKQGLWDNTIVVFTSDHGYHLGDHFLWGKVTLFDIGARVPFIVHAPGITQPGSHSDNMVELIDIFPTLTELAGMESPAQVQGTSLVPVLKDPSASNGKKWAYSLVTRGPKNGYAIRNQKWRYGLWPDGEELYDLAADPHERHNLARRNTYRSELKILRETLKRKQAEARSHHQR